MIFLFGEDSSLILPALSHLCIYGSHMVCGKEMGFRDKPQFKSWLYLHELCDFENAI